MRDDVQYNDNSGSTKKREFLTDQQAVFCFSFFFYNEKENDNKTITHGICKKCGAPNIKIVGISEKGRKAEEVEEIICKNEYCGIVVLSSRSHTKTIEKQPPHDDPPPIYRRERGYIKYR